MGFEPFNENRTHSALGQGWSDWPRYSNQPFGRFHTGLWWSGPVPPVLVHSPPPVATVPGPFDGRGSTLGQAWDQHVVRKRLFGHSRLRRLFGPSRISNFVYTFFAGRSDTPSPMCFEPWMVSWVRLGPEQHPSMSTLFFVVFLHYGFVTHVIILYPRFNPLQFVPVLLWCRPHRPPANRAVYVRLCIYLLLK